MKTLIASILTAVFAITATSSIAADAKKDDKKADAKKEQKK